MKLPHLTLFSLLLCKAFAQEKYIGAFTLEPAEYCTIILHHPFPTNNINPSEKYILCKGYSLPENHQKAKIKVFFKKENQEKQSTPHQINFELKLKIGDPIEILETSSSQNHTYAQRNITYKGSIFYKEFLLQDQAGVIKQSNSSETIVKIGESEQKPVYIIIRKSKNMKNLFKDESLTYQKIFNTADIKSYFKIQEAPLNPKTLILRKKFLEEKERTQQAEQLQRQKDEEALKHEE